MKTGLRQSKNKAFSIKGIAPTIEGYFHLMAPEDVPIDDEIAFYKELKEKTAIARLNKLKKAGNKTIEVFSSVEILPEQFDFFYSVKLNEYLKTIAFSTEKDFIEDELKKCNGWCANFPKNKRMKRWVECLEMKLQKINSVTRKADFTPLLFKDLFVNPALIEGSLDLLRKTEKPCINDELVFIRDKGVFVVWFNAMERRTMFTISFQNDKQRAQTLNINFKNLNISSSSFKNISSKATDNYKKDFENAIAALKG